MKATGAGPDKGGYYDGTKIVAFHGTLGGVLDTAQAGAAVTKADLNFNNRRARTNSFRR